MSVIVKGMEMPNACCYCPCSDSAGCAVTGRVMTTEGMAGQLGDIDDCPLRPLSEKHGRLIDADSLKETLDYYIREAGWDAKTNRVLGWVKDEFIDSEPTIVEAEGDI